MNLAKNGALELDSKMLPRVKAGTPIYKVSYTYIYDGLRLVVLWSCLLIPHVVRQELLKHRALWQA